MIIKTRQTLERFSLLICRSSRCPFASPFPLDVHSTSRCSTCPPRTEEAFGPVPLCFADRQMDAAPDNGSRVRHERVSMERQCSQSLHLFRYFHSSLSHSLCYHFSDPSVIFCTLCHHHSRIILSFHSPPLFFKSS